jgi:hypothetical protein
MNNALGEWQTTEDTSTSDLGSGQDCSSKDEDNDALRKRKMNGIVKSVEQKITEFFSIKPRP